MLNRQALTAIRLARKKIKKHSLPPANAPGSRAESSRNTVWSKLRGLLFGRSRLGGFVYLAVLGVPAFREPPGSEWAVSRENGLQRRWFAPQEILVHGRVMLTEGERFLTVQGEFGRITNIR